MTAKNNTALFDEATATEAKIAEMEQRASALKDRRAALTIDPKKDLEKEIAAKLKAEAAIDAELLPLGLALDHLKAGIDQQWGDVESFYLANVRLALEEMRTISERAEAIGLSFLEFLFPCEDDKEFRKVFKEPMNSFSTLYLKPLGALPKWMRGVRESLALFEEIDRLCNGWGGGSHNSTINTQQSYIAALRGMLDSYPSRKSSVEAAISELESRFPEGAATSTQDAA